MNSLARDLRYAFRMLVKSPTFTLVAVGSLALGVAGNATIFSLINGLLLRPLPVAQPERIAAIYTSDYSGGPFGATSYLDYLDFTRRLESFDQIVAMSLTPASLSAEAKTQRVMLGVVSGNYFSALGIPLAQGRGFTPEEDAVPGRDAVVVLNHALWIGRFGGDPQLIGKRVTLGGHPFTVIGVAPRGFHGVFRGVSQDGWIPLMMDPVIRPGSRDLTNRGDRSQFLFGRLKPGRTTESAQAEARVVAAQMAKSYPGDWSSLQGTGRDITVLPESQARLYPEARGPVLGATALLWVVAGLVLLIACANIANLLLSRAVARRKEIAVRLSLGASRGRLIQQLLTESVAIALLGGGVGLLLAIWVCDLLSNFRPNLPVRVILDLHPDARVLAFTAAVSVFTGVLLGLAPALQATSPTLTGALKDDTGLGGTRRSRLRSAFVVAQVGFSLVLLLGAGLFLRSLQNATAIDPGFGIGQGLLVTVDLSLNGYTEDRARALQQELVQRVGAVPGVEAVSLATVMPLSIGAERRGISVESYSPRAGEDMEFHDSKVGPGYFETMRVPLLKGRGFTAEDRSGAPGVVVVNQTFADRFWPGQNAVGRRISVEGDQGPFLDVIGVAKDGKYLTLGEESRPFFYLPLLQQFDARTTLIARTTGAPADLANAVRAELRALDPDLPIETLETVGEHIGFSLLPARVAGTVLGAFGLLGLLLASLGVYGVVAYAVGQRTREIGVRMALGARAEDVLRLILGEGLRLVGLGLAGGLLIALGVTHLIRGLLYGLSPFDPLTFLAVSLLFAAIVAGASYLPARRAAKVDPMVALRTE